MRHIRDLCLSFSFDFTFSERIRTSTSWNLLLICFISSSKNPTTHTKNNKVPLLDVGCWILFLSVITILWFNIHMHRDVCTKECTFWHACVKLISFCWCSHFLCWWCVLFQWKAHCLPYNNLKFSHFTFFLCSCNGIYLNFIIRLCSRSSILMEHIHT